MKLSSSSSSITTPTIATCPFATTTTTFPYSTDIQ